MGMARDRSVPEKPLTMPIHPLQCVLLLTLAAPLIATAERLKELALTVQAAGLNQWIGLTGDNRQRPYLIVDKHSAHMWIYDKQGKLLASSAVLLGSAVGDTSVEDIGTRPFSRIKPHEKTTPAGRFFLEAGMNTDGESVFWIDYSAAVSIHRVRPGQPGDKRLQRLMSETVTDNRITFGCINVPISIYNRNIDELFKISGGYAYILPEVMEINRAFPFLHSLVLRPPEQEARTRIPSPVNLLMLETPVYLFTRSNL